MERKEITIAKIDKTVGAVRERERESNRLEKHALFCGAKQYIENIANKDRYA